MIRENMMLLTISLLLLQAGTPVQIPELQLPTRDAAPNTPAEIATLRAGDALYEQGKLDDAIARYEEVLKSNPNNVIAIPFTATSASITASSGSLPIR